MQMQKKLIRVNDTESTGETKFAPISVVDYYPDSDSNTQSSWFIGGGSCQTSPATSPKSRNKNNLAPAGASGESAPQSLQGDSAVALKHIPISFELCFLFSSEVSQSVSLADLPTPIGTPNGSSENLARTFSEEQIHANRPPSKPIAVNTSSTRTSRYKRKF
jgi:hypothetical protein